MTLNNKPYSSRFGIRFDASLQPSFIGVWVWGGLHLGACMIVWQLNWPYWLCLSADIIILWLMVRTVNRYVFLITCYQLSFLFGEQDSWVIQENENICYRAVLRYAFCGKYLVILIFENKLIFPIFFDSLPAAQFRQLRKVLILLDYV